MAIASLSPLLLTEGRSARDIPSSCQQNQLSCCELYSLCDHPPKAFLRGFCPQEPSRFCFTRFHQDLGWLSCLRSPTFRHAVDHLVIRVSPDISASLLLTLDTCHRCVLPYDRMRGLVRGISNPMTPLLVHRR